MHKIDFEKARALIHSLKKIEGFTRLFEKFVGYNNPK